MTFKDRADAGIRLARALEKFKDSKDAIILALPRGGVVTAFEVAKELHLPLDLVVPRKIGAPHDEEFAIGAITETGEGIFDEATIDAYHIPKSYIDKKVAQEQHEARRRLKTYRVDRPQKLELAGTTAIIIDDGIATGLTMRAAIASVRKRNPSKIVVAVPVSAADSAAAITREVHEFISLDIPAYFGAVGSCYTSFPQTEDAEVIELMKKSKKFGLQS